jgi:hypothetical protein
VLTIMQGRVIRFRVARSRPDQRQIFSPPLPLQRTLVVQLVLLSPVTSPFLLQRKLPLAKTNWIRNLHIRTDYLAKAAQASSTNPSINVTTKPLSNLVLKATRLAYVGKFIFFEPARLLPGRGN